MRWLVVGSGLVLFGCQPLPPEPVEATEAEESPDETKLIRFEASLSRADGVLAGRGSLRRAPIDARSSLFIHAKARCVGDDAIEVDLVRVPAMEEFELRFFGPDAPVSPREPCDVELRLVDTNGATQRPLGIFCVDSSGAARGICEQGLVPASSRKFDRVVVVERLRPSFISGLSVALAAIPATDVAYLSVGGLATCEASGREYSDEDTAYVSDSVFMTREREATPGRLEFFDGPAWERTDFEQTRCQLTFEISGPLDLSDPIDVCLDHGEVREGRCEGFSHGVHIPSKRVLENPAFFVREDEHFFGEPDYSVLFVADVIRGEDWGEHLRARAFCDVDGTPEEVRVPFWSRPFVPGGRRARGYLTLMGGLANPPAGCTVELFSEDGTKLTARYCWDGHAAAECS